MNIENFSTTNLPGLADLGDTKGPSGELFVEKAPIKGKEDLIHRSRKK